MAKREDIADVLVIGAGASGGAFTWSLSQAGIRVVCLDQGGWVPWTPIPPASPTAYCTGKPIFTPIPT